MGSPEEEEGRNTDEGPVYPVTLSPFLIAKYELVQAQWEAVMGSNPSAFCGPNRPVEQVSWDDCQAFCTTTSLRFPTEAQWEYACRAGTTGLYGGSGILEEMGWYSSNSENHTHDSSTPACRSAYRVEGTPSSRGSNRGFRPAFWPLP